MPLPSAAERSGEAEAAAFPEYSSKSTCLVERERCDSHMRKPSARCLDQAVRGGRDRECLPSGTAASFSLTWVATPKSCPSGMLLHKKNDNREANYRSLMRCTVPGAALGGSGSERNKNWGFTTMKARAVSMPESKVTPLLRPR